MMDKKYFEEIKAREQAAAPGPWKTGDGSKKCGYNGANVIVAAKDGQPYVVMDRAVYPKETKFNKQVLADIKFTAHARTDIPALIAEVERLAKENQGLRANSIVQEHIISGGRDPIRDGEIARLIMDNAAKDQQIATLKKALEYACADRATTPSMWQDLQKKYMEIAHQAQEREGKK